MQLRQPCLLLLLLSACPGLKLLPPLQQGLAALLQALLSLGIPPVRCQAGGCRRRRCLH